MAIIRRQPPILDSPRIKSERKMREAELSPILRQWFESQGYSVWVEIPVSYHSVDMVARKGPEIICVELKMTLSKEVIHQAYHNFIVTNRSYVAVPTRPVGASIEKCKHAGLGILHVRDIVETILEPSGDCFGFAPQIDKLHAVLDSIPPEGVAGYPTRKGEGPAIDCFQRIKEYVKDNPSAKWKDIFANVQNHYYSMQSMRSAITNRFGSPWEAHRDPKA